MLYAHCNFTSIVIIIIYLQKKSIGIPWQQRYRSYTVDVCVMIRMG